MWFLYLFLWVSKICRKNISSINAGTVRCACHTLKGQQLPYTRVFQTSLSVLIVYFAASLALDNFMCLVCKPFWLSTSVLTGHAYKSFEWNRLLSFYIFHYLSVVSLSLLLFLSHTHTHTTFCLLLFLSHTHTHTTFCLLLDWILCFKNTQNYTKKIFMSQIITMG